VTDNSDSRNQYIACFLILLALAAVAIADKWIFRDLANAGQTVLGFGGGILTGKYLSQTTSKGGGDIINPPADNSPKP